MDTEMDRVSYHEERVINVGEYEKIGCSLRFTTSFIPVNNTEKKVAISHSDSQVVNPVETFDEAAKRAVDNVKKVLDKRERILRGRSRKYVDFPTSEKGKVMTGKIKPIQKKKKKKRSTSFNI